MFNTLSWWLGYLEKKLWFIDYHHGKSKNPHGYGHIICIAIGVWTNLKINILPVIEIKKKHGNRVVYILTREFFLQRLNKSSNQLVGFFSKIIIMKLWK